MLIEQIKKNLEESLRSKDALRVSTLRLLLAEIRNRYIEKQKELTDEDIVAVIRHGIKQRQEAIEAYQRGNRNDLAQKEQRELEILSKYLPQQMTPSQIEEIIQQTVSEIGPCGLADFGKVMGTVMKKVKGKADGSLVSELVKNTLDPQGPVK